MKKKRHPLVALPHSANLRNKRSLYKCAGDHYDCTAFKRRQRDRLRAIQRSA